MNQHEKGSVNQKGTESTDKWPLKIERLDEAKKKEILQIVERVVERNHELEMNCAERTFATIYDAFEKYTDLPRGVGRLTTAFGGGGGSTSYGLCGAVTGALMGIGLFWGRVDPMDFFQTVGLNSIEEAKQNPEQAHEYSRIFNFFMKEFEDSFGSLICSQLIKDYLDPGGFYIPDETVVEERKALCKRFTVWAPLRAIELIFEGQEKGTQGMKMMHNLRNTE
jgi:C_GCAxxG_C_C family probable redox protein